MSLKNSFKAVSFLFFILFFCSFGAYAVESDVASRITEVTVYSDSALVTRVVDLDLERGEFKIVLSDIIPNIDENSLRVLARGDAKVTLYGAQLRREHVEEDPSEKVNQLQSKIQQLRDEIVVWQNQKAILDDKKSFLDSVRLFSGEQVPKDLATKIPSSEELKNLLEFLNVNLKENFSLRTEADLKIRELTNKRDVLRRRLAEISGPRRRIKRSIVIDLEVVEPGALDLDITYLARGASWRPIYDARADFRSSEVELVSYGVIRQNTGENWNDAKITLSTAKPAIDARMPRVTPWIIRPYDPSVSRRPRTEIWSKTAISRQMVFSESSEPEEPLDEYARVEETGIAVNYRLARRATIKSDGSDHKVPVSAQTLKADFEYSAYPRLSPLAYLRSRVTNEADLQLLAGRVNIFFDGAFVGSSGIDNIAPGEEFDLYLGVDENVKVERELVKREVDDTWIVGIPARTKRINHCYKLSVENYKSQKINMKLFEAIPVSQEDRIKIKTSGVTQEPAQKDWQDQQGIWLWEFKLEPREKKDIFYEFTVECPRDMQVEGL